MVEMPFTLHLALPCGDSCVIFIWPPCLQWYLKKIQGARYLHKKTWTEQKCILKYTYWVNDALFWKRHWYAGSDRKRSLALLLLVLQQSATGSHYFIHFLCLHFHTSIRPNSTVHLGPFPHYSFQNWCVEKGLRESQTMEISLKTVEIALM